MAKSILFLLLALIGLQTYAQQKHTVSGTIKEKKSGEVLIGASIYLRELPKIGAVSNSYLIADCFPIPLLFTAIITTT